MAELLKVTGLCKGEILKDVSFSVGRGEMVAVMGPSGSGKSTLLYQVSGMDRPTAGEIVLGGTSLTGLSEDELARLRLTRMGFVFQQMNMLKNLTVLDNILLPTSQTARSRAERAAAEKRAADLLEKMGIASLARRRIDEVSGGQLQRACICRSMMNDPEVLFADEPTGALNQSAAAEVMAEFTRLNREGTTILMVTHDSRVASRCGRIMYLLDGGIRGELYLYGEKEERERQTARWLSQMGW